jgi:hypothetical protein
MRYTIDIVEDMMADFVGQLYPDAGHRVQVCVSNARDLRVKRRRKRMGSSLLPVKLWHDLHVKDQEYLDEYPSQVVEMACRMHFTNINHTIPWFGPMLYWLARANGATRILEIGHAEGYTARYLAQAVKDNAIRWGVTDGMYWGIDIIQKENVEKGLDSLYLPHTIIECDTINLTSEMCDRWFGDKPIDIIFQDGCHDAANVVHEADILYDYLSSAGRGYWIAHDCDSFAREGYDDIIANPAYNWECCRLFDNVNGLAIMRKMDRYDHEKRAMD